MGNRLALVLGIVSLGAVAWGQLPTAANGVAKPLVYDVVSVHENKSATNYDSFNGTSSGVQITAPLVEMLKEAYGLFYLNDDQVIGLPPWAKSKSFDLEAKVADQDVNAYRKLTRAEKGSMLQGVLEDRFRMRAHRVSTEGAVYNLVVDKHGSKLAVTNPEANGPVGSHVSDCKAGCMSSNNGHMEAKGVGIASIAGFLNRETQKTVIDKTGLVGDYDFTLDWTSLSNGPKDATEQSGAPPEIFTAIVQQLGLKLEPAKGPVNTIVIDHIEEPSAN